ncbi:basic helix-loop-helix protein [Coemansia brasiliensis]|uniref:Basic helix-loop-helix protein n=1 Tax=Coemansia brasiliensis TaxID=2650707 RepID=A0A9W8I9V7_9FUNG|nr:basic helix-loop-helix protein [Coemansia brasiliensis]
MSTSSPNSSVLLTVEEKPNTRSSAQYTAIAPRTSTSGPQPIAPATNSRAEGVPLTGSGSTNHSTGDSTEGSEAMSKRKRGKETVEPGSPEWQRMRRDSHKEVERRRREVINNGIDRLAELVPGAEKNKGRIIAQAVEYIARLRANEEKNIEKWTIDKLLADQAISELTGKVEELKSENKRLREQIHSLGGEVEEREPSVPKESHETHQASEESELMLEAVAAAAAVAANSNEQANDAEPSTRKSRQAKNKK